MSETGSGCVAVAGLTVCSPRGQRYRAVRYCHACKRRRRFLVTEFVWYGAEVVCCSCTTRWSDGQRRPASRSARVRDRERRKLAASWAAETGTRAEARAAIFAEVKATFPAPSPSEESGE